MARPLHVHDPAPRGLLVGLLAITTSVLRERLEESRAHIVVLATTDALTGVLNRRAFLEQSQALVALRDRPSRWVLMLDIDHFKAVNDGFGHLAGDRVLAEIAKRAQSCLREGDLFGRYGGEEFVALLQGGPQSDVSGAAERILAAIRTEAVHAEGAEIGVTVSGGLSALSETEHDVWAAVARADDALYRSKNAGRDRLSVELVAGV
jgi:diguanylate cyclase (GGDEF)-like protein